MADPGKALWASFFNQFDPPERITKVSGRNTTGSSLRKHQARPAVTMFSFEMFPWQIEPLNMVDNPDYGRMC